MVRRTAIWIALIVLFVPSGMQAGQEPLRIGMSAAFSGPIGSLGVEVYKGAMAYFEHVNRKGGINGRLVKLIAYDDAYDPAIALNNTVRLIEEDKVDLLFSYVGTPTVTRILPLLKVYEERNVFLFFPVTGADPHRRPPYDQYVYNLRASYSEEVEALVREFFSQGITRFAILHQADAYGRSGWEGLREALHRRSLAIVAEATYGRGFRFEQSMREQVEILRRAEPEVVITISTYPASAAFIRDARDLDWDVPVANVSFVNSESMLALLLEQGKSSGKDYTFNLVNSQVVPSYEDQSLWGVMEYRWIMDQCICPMPPQLTLEDHVPHHYSFASLEGLLNAKVLTEMLSKIPFDVISGQSDDHGDNHVLINLGVGEPIFLGPHRRQGMHRVYFSTVRADQFVPLLDWPGWVRP